MSNERSSSAVRNLRSLFEKKGPEASDTPDTRGRSTSGTSAANSDRASGSPRPTSKVRASFVSVNPRAGMAANPETLQEGAIDHKRASTADLRRTSFHGADSDKALEQLKKTVVDEQEKRDGQGNGNETIPETAVESVAATPRQNPFDEKAQGARGPVKKRDQEPENPDKHITGEQEDPAKMKPGNPTNEKAVSGGKALPTAAEDLRPASQDAACKAKSAVAKKPEAGKPEAKKPTANGKPAAVSTRAPSQPRSSMKSPPAQPKSPHATKADSSLAAGQKAPAKKTSRTSLTAPTAASSARHADKTTKSSTETPKPRETTKPAALPSHLTAPTAASRAKHDPAAPTTSSKPSTTTKPKPPPTSSTTRPARASLAPNTTRQRSASRNSGAATARKPAPPPDGSFLERMMRPTAASASKTHEKTEVKSPPRTQKTTGKPRPNGHANKPAGKGAAAAAADAGEKAAEEKLEDATTLDETVADGTVTEQAGEPVEPLADETAEATSTAHVETELPAATGDEVEEVKPAPKDENQVPQLSSAPMEAALDVPAAPAEEPITAPVEEAPVAPAAPLAPAAQEATVEPAEETQEDIEAALAAFEPKDVTMGPVAEATPEPTLESATQPAGGKETSPQILGGAETPSHRNAGDEASLEATPAGLAEGTGEAIR